MLLPYRAKNPPPYFPFVTVSLIAINTIVFAATSDSFVSVRDDAVRDYAFTHANLSMMRILTAMFLHANIIHLAGNMLFLWIFGTSVEGRLRPVKFLILYLAAGFAGGLLQDVLTGMINPDIPNLGASGAIMGVAGAFFYMFPYATVVVAWALSYFRFGVSDWQARWVILIYVGLDLLEAFVFQGADGVGHFAHLGGFGAGMLITFLFRAKRDSESRSAAQASRTDEGHNLGVLSFRELQALMEHPAGNSQLILAFLTKGTSEATAATQVACLAALQQHYRLLLDTVDPLNLAEIALRIPIIVGTMPPSFYLLLGSRVEAENARDLANQLYYRVYEIDPQSPDTEIALLRQAHIAEQTPGNTAATTIYREMLRLFPNGELSSQARTALKRMAGTAGTLV